MAETAAERAEAVQTVLTATTGDDPTVRAAALNSLIPVPDQTAANDLWKYLVIGLLALILIALLGLLFMIGDGDADTSPDLVVTAFSSLLTGLLGLFIKSPTSQS
jgi:hypothetical protein